MRFFALTLVLGASCSAIASFDLMLVRDVAKIHRLDPVSGAYLGSFPVSISYSTMTASYVHKSLYVVGGGYTLASMDYNTGNFRALGPSLESYPTSMVMSRDQSTLYVAMQSGAVAQFDAATLVRGSDVIAASGEAIHSVYASESGFLAVTQSTSSGHVLRTYNSAGSVISSLQIDSNLGSMVNGLCVNNTTAYFARATGGLYGGATIDPATGVLSSLFLAGAVSMASLVGMHDAHIGAYWTGLDANAANGLRVQYINPFNAYDRVFNYSQITSPFSTALVLAPEPTSLTALALGGLALIRRRRQGK